MTVLKLFFALLFVVLGPGISVASKPVPNRAYVQSGPDGVFYARCIPEENTGTKGTTNIFRVAIDEDVLVDSYDWYSPRTVLLGWSPIAGKVAVMSMQEERVPNDDSVQFSFHLGGQLLRAYTTEDLRGLGIKIPKIAKRPYFAYRAIGCEQVPGEANVYVFSIKGSNNKKYSFDITTGELVSVDGDHVPRESFHPDSFDSSKRRSP